MDRADVFALPPSHLTVTRRLRASCRPERIGLLNAIVDAYEGLAVVRTLDAREGRVEFWVSQKEENVLRLILRDLAKQIDLQLEDEHEG